MVTKLGLVVTASLFRVDDAFGTYGEHGFGLGQRGTVVDLAHSRLAAAFAEVETRRARVGHDVATDRLLGVGLEHGGAVDCGNHLVGNDDSHSKLERKIENLVKIL